ncbi:TraB/GumN family protein [Motilimonas pumila]|uniref:TraB/GumN family protein n=1 Tax=Motilimonas pumila TaxID=2303987 RepID=A0A418YBH2_9GAMM|nr:TraB/GumN family protein [Motilimonas pumila]RJG40264.1 TraB/GumN family protein [Motilimonas pumila]
MPLSRLCTVICILLLLVVSTPAGFASNSQPAYWQLIHQNGTKLTVLGSIHIGHKGLYPLPMPLMQAFNEADSLIVEVNIAAISPQHKLQAANIIRLTPGKSLPDVLNETDWQALQQAATKLSLDLKSFYGFQPWFVTLNLMQTAFAKQGYQVDKGIDQYFLTQALLSSKPIVQFETLPQQMQLLREVALRDNLTLAEGLTQLDKVANVTQQSLQAWQRGDLDQLEQLLLALDDMPPGSPSYQLMLTSRNHAWVDIIQQQPIKKHYFILVGALHLTGPDSLITLLKHAGFQVQRKPKAD